MTDSSSKIFTTNYFTPENLSWRILRRVRAAASFPRGFKQDDVVIPAWHAESYQAQQWMVKVRHAKCYLQWPADSATTGYIYFIIQGTCEIFCCLNSTNINIKQGSKTLLYNYYERFKMNSIIVSKNCFSSMNLSTLLNHFEIANHFESFDVYVVFRYFKKGTNKRKIYISMPQRTRIGPFGHSRVNFTTDWPEVSIPSHSLVRIL